MNCLVLANIDHRNHVTDEGLQLEAGLQASGWTLAGFGYGDGCVDVPTLLERHQPRVVLISAREDWDESSSGCFDKRCSFRRINALATRLDIFKIQVVKDCPGILDRRKAWCEEIKASAILLYYHPTSMLAVSPWLSEYPLVRTWHTIDVEQCDELLLCTGLLYQSRKPVLVSGAASPHVYPLRTSAITNARTIGFDVLKHPGYAGRHCQSNQYLKSLSQYRVHLATASTYGFALRKIIETVAVGTIPLTDLPEYDELPAINGALVRIDSKISISDLKLIAQHSAETWNAAERFEWARKCHAFYDWRVRGKALSDEILRLAA